jgi:hypothetical protein
MTENDVLNELISRLDSVWPDLQTTYEELLEDPDFEDCDELTRYIVRVAYKCCIQTHDPDVAQRMLTDQLKETRIELSDVISNL